MEVKIEKEGLKFNVRSSCIIKDKNHKKVLLTLMRAIKDHDAYMLPGGRLDIFENTKEALVREIEEELGIRLDYNLISIYEVISEEENYHMIDFVYYTEVEDFSIIKSLDNGWDKFIIIDISDIDEYDIRPKTVLSLIKKNAYNNISHNVDYDWIK